MAVSGRDTQEIDLAIPSVLTKKGRKKKHREFKSLSDIRESQRMKQTKRQTANGMSVGGY
jgi:hypothetical protein